MRLYCIDIPTIFASFFAVVAACSTPASVVIFAVQCSFFIIPLTLRLYIYKLPINPLLLSSAVVMCSLCPLKGGSCYVPKQRAASARQRSMERL